MSGRHLIAVQDLRGRMRDATADAGLRSNIRNATDTLEVRRQRAYADLADVEDTRHVARAVKHRIIRRLPEILERLADNVLAAGGHVCWATNSEEATRYVLDVAARRQARRVVKSKSMATEEIGLTASMEGDGLHVDETDLGEWIVQLAQETPSHIIVPAVHRNRREIAEVLRRVAGGDLSDVPEELAAFARATLRQRFLEADLAVSGVNFGVAETGSVVLVTNEGNGRLCTSLPPVHIAVMGMERVVETWDELDVFLALLPRAATGQSITSYVNAVTGPRRPGEPEGPEEFHLVILDNGRSQFVGSELEDMLSCIRCGACLNVCPVYRQSGGHAYGWVYSGPMGAVLTPMLLDSPRAAEVADASSLCGACWDACPVAIPLQDLLLSLRRRKAADAGTIERLAWAAWAQTWRRPVGYRASLRAARPATALTRHRQPPGLLGNWGVGRSMPQPPKRTFSERWRAGER